MRRPVSIHLVRCGRTVPRSAPHPCHADDSPVALPDTPIADGSASPPRALAAAPVRTWVEVHGAVGAWIGAVRICVRIRVTITLAPNGW